MTRNELHKYFKIATDKNSQSVAFGGCPSFLPEEIDYWINTGYYQTISNKFTGNNVLKQPFEQSVKRIQDLQNLVRTDRNVTAINEDPNSNVCCVLNLFNGNRMFFVDAILKFGDNRANVKLLDHNTAQNFRQTYTNTPWVEDPIGVIEDNALYIYYDPISMSGQELKVDITFIKFPTKIENFPTDGIHEIPDNVWYEVIDRAVILALEDIESRRTQTKAQLNIVSE